MFNLAKEKERMYKWASNDDEVKYCLSEPNKDMKSYYTKYKNEKDHYLMEYSYETLPELQRLYEEYCGTTSDMQEIQKTVLIAAMKGKLYVEEEIETDTVEKQKELKEYIYGF